MTIVYCILGTAAFLLLLYLCFIAPRMFGKPERNAFVGRHYAHRGLFDNDGGIPENSIAAFRRAVDAGYGIELDVQLSKDGVPVVFHDASLRRMCGVEGNVWEYTLSELQSMRLLHSVETIPTFAEVLRTVNGKVPLIIEYKLDVPQTRVCELGDELLRNYVGPYCIESFHPMALTWYRKHRPEVMRGQLSENYQRNPKHRGNYSLLAMRFLISNVLTRPDFIAYNHIDRNNLSRRLCHIMGALSVAYTIKSQEQYEAAKGDFDLFIFDGCRL